MDESGKYGENKPLINEGTLYKPDPNEKKFGQLPEFGTTKWRWFILFGFCGLSLSTTFVQVCLAPIIVPVSKAFDTDITIVYVSLLSTNILFPIVYPLAILAYHKFSHHHVLICAAIIQLIGVWIRYTSTLFDNSFTPILVG